jgi:hypothetical protein
VVQKQPQLEARIRHRQPDIAPTCLHNCRVNVVLIRVNDTPHLIEAARTPIPVAGCCPHNRRRVDAFLAEFDRDVSLPNSFPKAVEIVSLGAKCATVDQKRSSAFDDRLAAIS